jgi:ABC-type dipeptide/oligopeptide/nickel transport system permease component
MFIIFAAVRLIGDPVLLMAPPDATMEDIEQIRIMLGLDKPIPVQFYTYVSGVLRGNFGMSLRWQIPAFQLWLSRLPYTLLLAIPVSILGFPIGLILGILGAIKVNKWPDNLSRLFAFIGMSMPQFWVAIMLVMVFAVRLGWFPTSGWGGVEYLVLPTACMLIGGMAGTIRFARTCMLEVLDAEYIKMARIKGVSNYAVIVKHAFRNASMPIITGMILGLPGLITGALLIEMIFNWPGIGRLMIEAVWTRDYPLVQCAALLGSGLFLICSILVDIAYVYIDPRIRYR